MSIGDFDKTKSLEVTPPPDSSSSTPAVSCAVPVKLISGDDTITGTGEIVLDWGSISDSSNIAVYDETETLLDYYIESLDTTNETGILWVHRDWVRDGTVQIIVAYGGGTGTDQSSSISTVFSKDSSLTAGYLLNEDSGDATDCTGNGNTGVTNGNISYGISGVVDGAFGYGGTSSDYLELGDIHTDFNSTTDLTAEIWFKDLDTSSYQILWWYSYSGYNDNVIELNYSNAGDIDVQIVDFDYNFRNVSANSVYSQDEWVHVVITIDSASTELKLYVNGDQKDVNTSCNGTYDAADTPVRLAYDGASSNYFGGYTDSVFMYAGSFLEDDTINSRKDSSKINPDFFSQQAAEGGGKGSLNLINTQAELRISDIVTDSSSISATLTGVLTYHALYQVILETDSAYGGLPDGDYDLQIWNSGSLVATTGYTFYDSSSSTSPPPDSSEMNDSSHDSSVAKGTTDIQVVDGVGYGILDMRTDKARELVTQSAKIPVTVLIYDWLNQYLLVRLSTTLYRNEAGF